MSTSAGTLAMPMLCAAVMGFAIQRGSTCSVAAMEEAVLERKFSRLLALLEAAAWVAGLLLAAHVAWGVDQAPSDYHVSWLTAVGGILFGLGAFLNGGCAIGTIVGVANGNSNYLFTLAGMFGGYVSHRAIDRMFTARDAHEPYAFAIATPLLLGFGVLFCWRLWHGYRFVRSHGALHRALRQAWVPHTAVSVTATAFVISAILFRPWAYTELLQDVALGTGAMHTERAILLVTLFGGALVAGITMERWRPVRPTLATATRCAIGGAVMAWASMLIPGQNEVLLLYAMPMLRPYAWIASAFMLATIALLIVLSQRLQRG
jgi:toxin CptA